MEYAVLDVARIGYELERIQPLASLWLSLYRGPEDAQQEEMAPCLAGYEPGDAFADWFTQAANGQAGVGIETDATPEALRKHLRRFLMVELEGDSETPSRKVYFRYYDPAILGVFLPTCSQTQLTDFFGPVRAFTITDAEAGRRLRFTVEAGQLQTRFLSYQ